jgi:hypothetical protein
VGSNEFGGLGKPKRELENKGMLKVLDLRLKEEIILRRMTRRFHRMD